MKCRILKLYLVMEPKQTTPHLDKNSQSWCKGLSMGLSVFGPGWSQKNPELLGLKFKYKMFIHVYISWLRNWRGCSGLTNSENSELVAEGQNFSQTYRKLTSVSVKSLTWSESKSCVKILVFLLIQSWYVKESHHVSVSMDSGGDFMVLNKCSTKSHKREDRSLILILPRPCHICWKRTLALFSLYSPPRAGCQPKHK